MENKEIGYNAWNISLVTSDTDILSHWRIYLKLINNYKTIQPRSTWEINIL